MEYLSFIVLLFNNRLLIMEFQHNTTIKKHNLSNFVLSGTACEITTKNHRILSQDSPGQELPANDLLIIA